MLLPLFVLILLPVQSFAAPRVAVFDQKGFPFYMVSILVQPQRIAAMLRKAGVQADLLNANSLANPAVFNTKRYGALVLPYGNTYPQAAFGNIQAFHKAGGALVLSGVPFTHPVVYQKGAGWRDTGNNNHAAGFGPKGMGVGGFGNSLAPPALSSHDPLDLRALKLNWTDRETVQTIDAGTFPPADRIFPILQEGSQPVAALIMHNDSQFPKAADVWTHHPDMGELDPWVTMQMLARGALLALHVKGELTPAQILHGYAVLNHMPSRSAYTNITLPVLSRPYSTLQPKMAQPARHLLVVHVKSLTPEQRILLLTLQGLVNRQQPRIYLIFDKSDAFWLKQMQKQGSTGTPVAVKNWRSLLAHFKTLVHGAVIPDPKVYLSEDVAVDAAAAYNLLPASPALAHKLHLPIKLDLRGRFHNDADALKYLRTQLMPHLNPWLALWLDPSILDTGAIDQIVAAKGITLWVTGPAAQNLPGADMAGELRQAKAILAKMPLDSVVHGFYWHGGGVGIDEGPGVALASQFGKITTVSDYVANYSVMSGVQLKSIKQKYHPAAPAYDPGKVYLAITISDGDNYCTWRDFFRRYFQNPLHGTFPIGWGMGPGLIDCAPTEVKWYYSHADPEDEFICDVSGVGYMYPPEWAADLKHRNAAFKAFYSLTGQYMHRLDMHTLRLMGVNADSIAKVGPLLPDISFLMPDYGYQGENSYSQLTYTLPNGQEVFRAGTGGGTAEQLAQDVKARVGSTRPAFLNVFCMNWSTSLQSLHDMLKLLGPNYVAVTPSQLAQLYADYLAKERQP